MGGDEKESAQLASIETSLAQIAARDSVAELRFKHLTESITLLAKTNTEMSESVNEMVKAQLTIRHELEKSDEIQKLKNDDQDSDIIDLQGRVRTLERYNDQNHGERRASDKRKNWWSENWYKIVGVFIICIPLIDLLYDQVTGKKYERQVIIKRDEDGGSINTKR